MLVDALKELDRRSDQILVVDSDPTDLEFRDTTADTLVFWIVEGRGPDGDGPWGHFGQ